jgi:hypothetical protein
LLMRFHNLRGSINSVIQDTPPAAGILKAQALYRGCSLYSTNGICLACRAPGSGGAITSQSVYNTVVAYAKQIGLTLAPTTV